MGWGNGKSNSHSAGVISVRSKDGDGKNDANGKDVLLMYAKSHLPSMLSALVHGVSAYFS